MRFKIFSTGLIFFAAFSVGAFLGRRWMGALANTVLSIAALLAVVFVGIAIAGYWRARARVVAMPLAPSVSGEAKADERDRGGFSLGSHLVILRRDEKLVLRLQDWWRFESLDFALALPRRHAAAPAPLSVARRSGYVLIGLGLVLFAQYLMFRLESALIRFPFSERLNVLFRIDVPNLDNVILAVLLLAVGGFFFARGITLPFADPEFSDGSFTLFQVLSKIRGRLGAIAVAAAILFLFLVWRLSDGDVGGWLPIVWIAVLVLGGVAVYLFDRRANIPLSPGLQWRDVILIALLCALGLVVGTYQLAQVPNSLIGDEGSFWETARAIAFGEYRPSIFDFGVYSYPILGSFYQAAILKLFGLSLWSWRFASVLIAVAAVAPTYLLAREMFDRRVAVLASAVMVVTPYFIAIERLGYNNAQALFPVALALFLLYAGLKRGSAFYLYLGGVAAGLGFYSYTAGRLAVVVGGLYFAYLLGRRLLHRFDQTAAPFEKALRPLVALGVVFAMGWAVAALPHLVFGNAVSSDLLRTKTLESVLANDIYAHDFLPGENLYRDNPPIRIGPYTLFYRTDLIARLLVRGVARSFLVFQHAKLVTEHFIAGPLAGPAATLFYFLGLVVTLVSSRRKTFALLGLWFLSGVFLLSVVSTFPPRHTHMVSIIPALAILIAVGVIAAVDFIAAAIGQRRAAAAVMALGCCIVIGWTDLNNYFVTVQETYLPIPEHVMGFAQLALTSPRQMIYVYDDPAEKDFVPWEARTIPNLGEFHTVAVNDLTNGRWRIEPDQPYTFFFKDQNREATVDFLARVLNREIEPQPYFNREGQVILLSYAFGD